MNYDCMLNRVTPVQLACPMAYWGAAVERDLTRPSLCPTLCPRSAAVSSKRKADL